MIVILYLACRICCYICSRPIINFLIGDHTLFEFMAITYMLQAMFLPATLIHITQQLDCNSCMTRSCNSRRSFEPRSINTNANNAGSKSQLHFQVIICNPQSQEIFLNKLILFRLTFEMNDFRAMY